MLERIGDNAYKLEQLGDVSVNASFNVGDLTLVGDYFEDLRENPSQEGKAYAYQSSN